MFATCHGTHDVLHFVGLHFKGLLGKGCLMRLVLVCLLRRHTRDLRGEQQHMHGERDNLLQ